MPECAGNDAERRRGLALAVAGVDQQNAPFLLRRSDGFVDNGFLALHAPGVTLVSFRIGH